MVMPAAEWNLVVEVGSAAVLPVIDVVNLASVERDVTVRLTWLSLPWLGASRGELRLVDSIRPDAFHNT